MRRSREHLAGTFWDRSAEEQARASLRQTLSSLRRVCAEAHALINADSESVWLDAQAVEVDALHFERLAAGGSAQSPEQAVAPLSTASCSSGFSLREERFEQWMIGRAASAPRARGASLLGLGRPLHAVDRPDRGIAIAVEMLALDPSLEWAPSRAHAASIADGTEGSRIPAVSGVRPYPEPGARDAPAEETQRLAAEIGRDTSARDAPGTAARLGRSSARSPDADAADRAGEPPPVLPAERKQLTVLCARIRESIDSSDPEAALERAIRSWKPWSMPSGTSAGRSARSGTTV